MQTVEVSIQGISPLLMHRFGEVSELDDATRKALREEQTPRMAAASVANQAPDGSYYLPGAAISRLLREAGGGHKMRGTRKSVKYLVPAAVIVPEEAIPLRNGDGKSLAADWDVDSRPVTIPATKGRIMRHRPRFEHWSMTFRLEIDETVLPTKLVQQLLEEGGRRLGVGDFRPEKGGPFGRFSVISWKLG